MAILVTGGTGYLGSHTVVELVNHGYDVVIADNLSNSSIEALHHIEALTGQTIPFYLVDIRDKYGLYLIFDEHPIDTCIHFAGLKSVSESVYNSLQYYDNNVSGTITLLNALNDKNCRNIVFSSSATVYGQPIELPITEECPRGQCMNVYGRTKQMVEDILIDLHKSDTSWNVVLLRYFNPIGAHPSGNLGDNPNGIPNNLMPYITQVAVGRQPYLTVFGCDYDTNDGTGVRDYIHVMDLAAGHVKALKAINNQCGIAIYNLGTGRGYSVFEVIHAFEKATHLKIPFVIKNRRAGDIAAYYSCSDKAQRELGWFPQYDIHDMCRDAWNWQKKHPHGF